MVGQGWESATEASSRKTASFANVPCLPNSGSAASQGAYIALYHGFVYSHSNNDDNGKQLNRITYREGDIVTVELNPYDGTLTYSKEGVAPYVQQTSIRSTSN